MNQVVRRVSKIDDATLYQIYDAVALLFQNLNTSTSFTIVPGINTSEKFYPRDQAIGRQSITEASFNLPRPQGTLNLNFSRTLSSPAGRTPSANFDEFSFSFGNDTTLWSQDPQGPLRVLQVLDRYCIVQDPSQNEPDKSAALDALITGFGRTHEKLLASLDQKIIEAEQRRIEIDQEFAERETERRAAVQKALAELDAERKKLELQSHMAERRKLLRELAEQTSQAASKARLPNGVSLMRWTVFVATVGVASVAGWFSYLSFEAFHDNGTGAVEWVVLGRAVLASIVCLGSLVYAVTWLKGFYEADLENSRALDRFHYDLMRSSWIIETVLEVHHEAKGEVPVAWLEGVTKGLFDNETSRKANDSASQALAALLGFSASASFGPEGPKFDLGKNAKKLSKAASEENGDA